MKDLISDRMDLSACLAELTPGVKNQRARQTARMYLVTKVHVDW